MEQFISIITNYVTPILIAVVLVVLIIMLIKLIRVLTSLDGTVVRTQKTVDLTNDSLEKVQAPLDTVVNVSHSIDNLHKTTVDTAKKVKNTVNDGLDEIVSTVSDKIGAKKSSKKKTSTPSPDDIIKGA